MNGAACGEERKVESGQKLARAVITENHTNVGVTGIVKAKRYTGELFLENLTRNLPHKVYKQLRSV